MSPSPHCKLWTAIEGFFGIITISLCGILACSNLVARIRIDFFLYLFLLCRCTVAGWQLSLLWISAVISCDFKRLTGNGAESAACAPAVKRYKYRKTLSSNDIPLLPSLSLSIVSLSFSVRFLRICFLCGKFPPNSYDLQGQKQWRTQKLLSTFSLVKKFTL